MVFVCLLHTVQQSLNIDLLIKQYALSLPHIFVGIVYSFFSFLATFAKSMLNE